MQIKRYFKSVEERLKCLSPILPYLQTKDGIKTPLSIGSEIVVNEIVERMTTLYEQYWHEEELDQMLFFFRVLSEKSLSSQAKGLPAS